MAKLAPEELMRRVERALQVGGGLYAPADIEACVEEGRMQALTHEDSLVVTEILTSPRRKFVNVALAVGSLEHFEPLQDQLMALGREHGCDAIRMGGRRGWASILPRHGWAQIPVINFERRL